MKDNLIALAGVIIAVLIGGIVGAAIIESSIEKQCIYKGRLEFSGQMFSCQWLPGVEDKSETYERKAHPNKEVLK